VFSRRFQRRAIAIASILSIAAVAGGLIYLRAHRTIAPGQVPFSELLVHLDRGAVSAVVVNGDSLDFTLASGQTFRTTSPASYVTANAAFVSDMAKKHVRIEVRTLP
jgi:hypothetical protein